MSTVFFDVDTQIDFLYPAGALYVPGAERIVENVARLNRYAALHGHPVVSSADAHAENDAEFLHWPPHCVRGTAGQRKPSSLLLESRVEFRSRPGENVCQSAQQFVIEKQRLDCFSNPNLDPLLDRLNADRYVVYGVVTEICVQFALSGLLRRTRRVELVTDATRALDAAKAEQTIREFESAGGSAATAASLCQH